MSLLLSVLFVCNALFIAIANADIQPCLDSHEYQTGSYGGYPVQRFFSDPDVIAPVANVIVPRHENASSHRHILWSPVGTTVKKMVPQILDARDLSVVYQGVDVGPEAIGATVQQCNGTEYLTWWSGLQQQSHMAGYYYMMDSNYNIIYNFTAIDLPLGDAHELYITPQCTAVFTAYEPMPYNLSHWKIDEGFLLDSVFQEIDIATNKVLFQWRASDHVNVTDTYVWPGLTGQGHNVNQGFDFFHINSVQKDHHGNFLVSARHTHALYYVNGQDGKVQWTLGGRKNEFKDLSNGTATDFAWQHHARWTSSALDSLTVFDNSWSEYSQKPDHNGSRGLLLGLDVKEQTVTLKQAYLGLPGVPSMREGSIQSLPDANLNVIVGYGSEPAFTEFSADGTILHDVRMGPLRLNRDNADNYRAIKVDWTATPAWGPRIAAGPSAETTGCEMLSLGSTDGTLPVTSTTILLSQKFPVVNDTAYFSWNGATEVTEWIVLTSNRSSDLTDDRHAWRNVSRQGFETSVQIAGAGYFVRALALSANRTVLGATPVLDMRSGMLLEAPAVPRISVMTEWRGAATASYHGLLNGWTLKLIMAAVGLLMWRLLLSLRRSRSVTGRSLGLLYVWRRVHGWLAWRKMAYANDPYGEEGAMLVGYTSSLEKIFEENGEDSEDVPSRSVRLS